MKISEACERFITSRDALGICQSDINRPVKLKIFIPTGTSAALKVWEFDMTKGLNKVILRASPSLSELIERDWKLFIPNEKEKAAYEKAAKENPEIIKIDANKAPNTRLIKILELFDQAMCSNCHQIVHIGNYCQMCGVKLVPVQRLNNSFRKYVLKYISSNF